MLASYLKLAWKVLARRKFFTFVSLFGVSFTLLVLVIAVALLDHRFAPVAPEIHQDRTLRLSAVTLRGPEGSWSSHVGWKLLDRHARDLPGVEALALYREEGAQLSRARPGTYGVKSVNAAYWKVLAFDFREGGPFGEADVRDRRKVAVISQRARDRYFEDRPALGQVMELDGQRYQVIGVVTDPSSLRDAVNANVWIPITASARDAFAPVYIGDLNALFLLAPGADPSHTKAAFAERLTRFESPDPRRIDRVDAPLETTFEYQARQMFGRGDAGASRRLALAVALVFGFFLLLPAVNLVNLNVSRILERASEIGVRKAFGATSRTLVGQFLVENVLLTLVGGAIGIAASVVVLRALGQSGFVPRGGLVLNWRVTMYGVLLALAFGVVSGVYPAWRMSRLAPVRALKGGER